ncbi:DMT family transporter [Thalassolituus sp. C2-1]|uniref:DMT family transporter n=1 Tax=Venatorbacter sp. C2-1 TaxID=2597518 RepID=UPI001C978EA4|nr:DMT family transporter [Thalassolituus sp. C2-1]
MNSNASIWLLIVFSTLFWGSNFNAAHEIAGVVPPLTAAAERFFIALVIFWLFRWWSGKAESQLQWRDALVLAPLGILGVFGFNYAFFIALHSTTPLNAALIMALSPLVSVLLSVVLLNARMKAVQIAGMILAFIGVSLVITGGDFSQLNVASGDLWMLLACLVWSLYSVGSKKYAPHIPPLQFARWTVSIGAVALILLALVVEQPQLTIPQLTLKSHGILFYMGLCGSVLAYVFWLKGVQQLGPDKSAIAFNLVPVFTLLVSLILGVMPNALQVGGLVLVLCGVLVFNGKVALPSARKAEAGLGR